jgi:hypothetical protein
MKKWIAALGYGLLMTALFIGNTSMTSHWSNQESHAPVDSLLDTTALVWGIDLSHHQNKVDWDQIECDKPYFIFFSWIYRHLWRKIY